MADNELPLKTNTRNKRRRIGPSIQSTSTSSYANNRKLSDLFRNVSKLYQSAPLWPEDVWKAYSFHKIAGRLRCLDFEIDEKNMPLKKLLEDIPGIGNSTIFIIAEFLRHGRCFRVERRARDPVRIALRNIMAIWGIGRVTVS